MKNVTLKSMTLVNFKGHKNRTIDFSEETFISGKNASGKSTIFDGFIWLLFGKDQFDRKDFEIHPTIENKRLDRVDSEVSAIIDVDGRVMSLKRVLHQKWVRRRGSSEEMFDGDETLFYMNDVPLKASEYKARIDMIIDETVFKMITNPAYFLSLHWTKQREFLFQIAGTISDQYIAASNPAFHALLDSITGKSFADFKKELAARKKKLKDDLELIPSKVDQTQRLMPEAKDVEQINNELKQVDAEIATIDEQIQDRSSAIRKQYEEIQQKQKDINALKTQQQDVVFKENEASQKLGFEANQKRSELENKLKAAISKLGSAINFKDASEIKLNDLKKQAKEKEKEIEKLRLKWHEENAAEYKAQDGCLTCPVFNITCSDAQATGKHSEAQEKAKNAFFGAKQHMLNTISAEGSLKTDELNKLNNSINEAEKQFQNDTEAVNECQIEFEKVQSEQKSSSTWTPAPIVPEELPAWQELDKQIKAIQATIQDVQPVDNSALLEKKKGLISKRDELKDILSKQGLIVTYKEEIKSLEAKASDLAQQIADVEKQEFTIADFTRAKIEESEGRINSLFRIVKFQLFEKTIDGNEFECCTATNLSGVPIAATNTAEKVNAGLDIISTLCHFHNVTAPIFCDGRESVNDLLSVKSQLINLVVTMDPELVIQ